MKRYLIIFHVLMFVLVAPVQAQTQKKNFRKDFEDFKNKAKKEYSDFRKQAFAEYTKFVREAWEEFGAEPPVQIPEEEKVEPMVVPGYEEETAGFFSKLFGGGDKKKKDKKEAKKAEKEKQKREKTNNQLAVSTVIAAPKAAPVQPQPLSKVVQSRDANPYMTFDVFGTQCRVRIGDNCRFRLNGLSGDEIADKLNEFQKSQYDNMLYDCLEERKTHNFSDWAYYQMLLALTNKFYGNHTNEATLVLGFLFLQCEVLTADMLPFHGRTSKKTGVLAKNSGFGVIVILRSLLP
jgi:DNA replication initiation complex subunit (GINS family)